MDNQNPTQILPANPTPPAGNPLQNPPIQNEPADNNPVYVAPHVENPPPKKFSLSPKIIFIILALLILVVIGSSIYLSAGTQSKPTPKPTPSPTLKPTPTPDPTADWKTFIPKTNTYSIKYPSDWKIDTTLSPFSLSSVVISTVGLSFQVDENVGQGSLEDIAKDMAKKGTVSDTIVNGINGKAVDFKLPNLNNNTSNSLKQIQLINKGNEYTLILQNSEGTPGNILNQILSTFKFTDISPRPTCRPRPACLDATPRCLIPETSDMCPPKNSTGSGLTK